MTINNNNIFGAFTLGEVRSGRLTGDWLNKESVANYGWFGGGYSSTPAVFSTVDRIDFSNDSSTALVRGSLNAPAGRPLLAATGNSNYGWFGGGGISADVSTVDRIDFSNDSSTAPVRGSLSLARTALAATGNSNYGWFGGGLIINPTTPAVSTVDRIDFATDFSTASPRGPLSAARAYLAATGNSNYGWFGGGRLPTPAISYSTVDRIDFSNDFSTTSPRGPLSLARHGVAATGNSNYGWFGGGFTPAVLSRVDRIDFSNDSVTASVRGLLSLARVRSAGTGNSNFGWFGGGAPATATVNRIDFSNDSVTASPRGSLTAARESLAATSGVLNIRRQKAGNFGWFGGGFIPGPTITTARVDRIDFSNDLSTALFRGSLSIGTLANMAPTGNSNYGWFGGGIAPVPTFPPIYEASLNRIDFSNDFSNTLLRGTLSFSKSFLMATGNSNYGWFGGGYVNFPTPTTFSTVDRLDFSNDSAGVSVRGPLSSERYYLAATGNSNYGWSGGGAFGTFPYTTISTVQRIDFSNDSSTASVRGPLSLARGRLTSTGNSNYGWFGGGQIESSTPVISTVERIDFSNDSSTASVRGPLSLARVDPAATGNSNYGWFGGGFSSSGDSSRIDRIDFSSDSATASIRGSLAPVRSASAAVSNTHIG